MWQLMPTNVKPKMWYDHEFRIGVPIKYGKSTFYITSQMNSNHHNKNKKNSTYGTT